MNNNDITSARQDALQARFALRVAAALTEQTEQASPDISERLRHAREQALARAREARTTAATSATTNGHAPGGATLSLGGPDDNPWWNKVGVLLPLLALVVGLLLIQHWHDQKHMAAAADIDLSLLSDDLPPDAYGDPGFVEFLKNPRD